MVHLLALVVPICGILGLDPCPITPAPPYAITGVSVLPMDRERVLEGYTVIVRNGAIETLGPADKVSVPQDAVRIDGRGKYLIPGLTEMHTHLSPGAGDPGDGLGRSCAWRSPTGSPRCAASSLRPGSSRSETK
jgi:hypothetical protein